MEVRQDYRERAAPRSARSDRVTSARSVASGMTSYGATPRLEEMPVDQLQKILEERDATMQALHREIAELEQAPSENGARLAYLEHLFSTVGCEDVLRIKSPVLRGIANVIKDEHKILQEEATTSHQYTGHKSNPPADPKHEKAGLVLGRGCMPLDPLALEEAHWMIERKKKHHDVIDEVHYAGHLARPEQEPHHVFAVARNRVQRRPLPPATDEGGFWLDCPLEHEELAPLTPDPTAGWPVGAPASGKGHDGMPVDWLGMARQGISIAQLDEMMKYNCTPWSARAEGPQ
mmetsp:Transcript_48339/g.127647  ORF Transcript_48339/g.127647 Transcript_48339/m.127647 type:complete len:290 (+) Transcript_48339:98-967(+)